MDWCCESPLRLSGSGPGGIAGPISSRRSSGQQDEVPMMNSDARTITARDLLLEFLELRSLSPKLEDWTEEALANNAPRLIRLRRLAALFRAFELPWDPSEFMEGGFIQPDDPRYSTVLAKVVSELPECARRRGG